MALTKTARNALGLSGLLLVAVAAAAFVRWSRPGEREPSDERLLLDASRPVPGDGLVLAFRLERPGEVEVWVDLPEDASTEVEVGPPAPNDGRVGPYLPDPAQAFRFRATGRAREPEVRTLFAVGNYAVRVRPFPAAMGESPPVRVRVLSR